MYESSHVTWSRAVHVTARKSQESRVRNRIHTTANPLVIDEAGRELVRQEVQAINKVEAEKESIRKLVHENRKQVNSAGLLIPLAPQQVRVNSALMSKVEFGRIPGTTARISATGSDVAVLCGEVVRVVPQFG